MKKWGPLVLTLLAGILIGSSLSWRGPVRRQDRMVKMFSQKLDLTFEQREKLVKILNEKRTKMDEMRVSTKDEIRAILTPEQVEKYNALEAKRDARRKKRNGPRP